MIRIFMKTPCNESFCKTTVRVKEFFFIIVHNIITPNSIVYFIDSEVTKHINKIYHDCHVFTLENKIFHEN